MSLALTVGHSEDRRSSESSQRSSRSRKSKSGFEARLLDDLIEDRREYPLTADEFRKFMKKKYCEENFCFLVDLMELKKKSDENIREWNLEVKKLMDKYIFSGSDMEINIPGPLRESSVAYFKKLDETEDLRTKKLDTLFGPSEEEVRKLILSQKFVMQFEDTMLQNESDAMLWFRKKLMIGFFILSIAMTAIMIVFNISRWWRIWTLIPNQLMSFAAVSVFGKVCPYCAWQGVRHLNDEKSTAMVIKDAVFREYVQLRANQTFAFSVFMAFVLTAALVAIPESIPIAK